MIGMAAINDAVELVFKMGEAEMQALAAIKEAMVIIPDVACRTEEEETDKLAQAYAHLVLAKGLLEKMNGN